MFLAWVCLFFVLFFAAVILKLAQTTNMLITIFKWNKMDIWQVDGEVGGQGGGVGVCVGGGGG